MNKEQVEQELSSKGFYYESKTSSLIVIEGNYGYIDYWFTTGKWKCRQKNNNGFGLRTLLKYLDD